jgi:hypothetical protein
MADTTNLGITKPTVGADTDTWGGIVNTGLDDIDAVFKADGTGTSVGLNVGAGKVLAVAGALAYTGTLTGGTGVVNIGSGQVYKDASGNVGIGTNLPTAKLVVSGGGMAVQGNGYPATGAGWEFYTDTTTGSWAQSFNRTSSAWLDANWNALTHKFSTSGAERLRITSAGSVGIGTTLPAQILEVKELDQTGFTGMRVNNPTGNVGSAGIEFQVDATYSKAAIYQTRSAPNGKGDLIFAVDSNSDAANWVASDEKVRITSAGLVGIGTNSPLSLMHLSSASPRITITDTDTGADHRINADSSVGNLAFDVDYNSDTASPVVVFNIKGSEKLRITSAGLVGIGTNSPNYTMSVNGTGNFYSGVSGLGRIFLGDPTDTSGYVGLYRSALGPANSTTAANGLNFASIDGYTFNTGAVAFGAQTERMRITSAGLVGIGLSSPVVKLDVNGITGWNGGTTGQTAQIVGASSTITGGGNFRVLSNTTQAVNVGGALTFGGYYISTTTSVDFGAILGAKENSTSGNTAGYLAFGTRVNAGNMTERMRITSSGDLLVNTTSAIGAARFVVEQNTTTANPMAVSNPRSTASTDYSILFYRNASIVGSIQTTLSSTSYVTSSDYRLKENIAPMTGALYKVAQLKPCTYNWKLDGEASQGFIAHELAEVVPECVTGEKDAVDAEGNPQYQGIDTSFLVATLTAAIQEQQALIESLTARVSALEGN